MKPRYEEESANVGSDTKLSADWPNIASMWLRSKARELYCMHFANYKGIDLATGIIDGNASTARLWTELILTNTSYDWSITPEEGELQALGLQPAFPSPAEALCVLAGCTLIQSAEDGPFTEFWNYSVATLETPQIQYFNASVSN